MKKIKIYDSGKGILIMGDLDIIEARDLRLIYKRSDLFLTCLNEGKREVIKKITSKLPTPELKPGIYSEDVKVLVWDDDKVVARERYLLSIFKDVTTLSQRCAVWNSNYTPKEQNYNPQFTSSYKNFEALPNYTIEKNGPETVIQWEE
jgi:hypothetical protein